jgi:hypothetical protein
MGLFSNIIAAATTVAGGTGGWVATQDGPHFDVTVTRDGATAQVQVSVVGSGNLAPADHYASSEYRAWYDQHYGIAPLD